MRSWRPTVGVGVNRLGVCPAHDAVPRRPVRLLGCTHADLVGLVAGKVCLVDGSLVLTFNWRHRTDLFSGKHRRYGVNIQLLIDLPCCIVGACQVVPGSWHDMHCFRAAGWSDLVAHSGGGIADLGDAGAPELVVSVKKSTGADLAGTDRHFNTCLAKIRVAVEWGVAHLKNWRSLATRYRSDLTRITTDIHAIIRLQKLNE